MSRYAATVVGMDIGRQAQKRHCPRYMVAKKEIPWSNFYRRRH